MAALAFLSTTLMTGASKGYPGSRLQPGRDPEVVLQAAQPCFSILSGTSA